MIEADLQTPGLRKLGKHIARNSDFECGQIGASATKFGSYDFSFTYPRNLIPHPHLLVPSHQRTVSTSKGCNQWLSLAKPLLKVALAGGNRSLLACTSKCEWGISTLCLLYHPNCGCPAKKCKRKRVVYLTTTYME